MSDLLNGGRRCSCVHCLRSDETREVDKTAALRRSADRTHSEPPTTHKAARGPVMWPRLPNLPGRRPDSTTEGAA